MSKTSRVATAVAAGYVLGRFKKMRMAVMVGSALANDNVRQSALNLVKQGGGRFSAPSGASKTLTQQIGSKLLDAGKAAAIAAAASRVDSFSDRIAARSESMRGEETDEDEAADEDYEGDEPVDETDEVDEPTDEADDIDEYADEEPDEDEEPAEEEQRPTRSRRRGRSASPAR